MILDDWRDELRAAYIGLAQDAEPTLMHDRRADRFDRLMGEYDADVEKYLGRADQIILAARYALTGGRASLEPLTRTERDALDILRRWPNDDDETGDVA